MGAWYVLRFDDLAPNMRWDRFCRVRDLLMELRVPALLGVIPDNRDPELLRFPATAVDFFDEIQRLVHAGSDVAMHGFQHRYASADGGLLGLCPRSEFAGLPFEEQKAKLESGSSVLKRRGLQTDVFMAPGHSFDRETLRALREVGFRFVTDGYGLYPYEEAGLIFVPQMLARPRRMPVGVHTTCIHLNEISERGIGALERFIRRKRDSIIPFREAARLARRSKLNDASRFCSERLLRLARNARRGAATTLGR